MAKKRKPAEPKMWLILYKITGRESDDIITAAALSRYAHKTKQSGVNEIKSFLDEEYPSDEYTVKIISISGISWSKIKSAFSDFIDFDDDDDSGHDDDDAPQAPIDPEDHGVLVPVLFADLIDGLDL